MDLYGSTVILCFLSLPFGAAAPNAATGIGWLAALVLVDVLACTRDLLPTELDFPCRLILHPQPLWLAQSISKHKEKKQTHKTYHQCSHTVRN